MNNFNAGLQSTATPNTTSLLPPADGLEANYAWCEDICRRSRSSFFASFRLLDPPRRRAMYALYAFARITDDLGDNPAPAEERRELLDTWQASLGRLATSVEPRGAEVEEASPQPAERLPELAQFAPLWPALQSSVSEFGIPLHLLQAVVEGVRRDLVPQPPASWDELVDYCYHVASAVGLACVHIWQRSDHTDDFPTQAAIDCGVAFQLTNILRDIAEDAQHGRLYLPLSELERFDINPTRWLAGQPDGHWPELIRSVAAEAERRYQRGWATIECLSPRSQRMFALMWTSYRALLHRVVARRFALWDAKRIRLSPWQRFYLLTRSMLAPHIRQPSHHA
jgi:15-cis-phytoene synthase